MDPTTPTLPLLPREEWKTRVAALLTRVIAPFTADPCRAALDGLALLLLLIAIVVSVGLLASPTSTSPCKTFHAPDPIKVIVLALPMCLLPGVCYASYFGRYVLGGLLQPALALPQMVLAVILCEWLLICGAAAATVIVLMSGTALIAVIVAVCSSSCLIAAN